jgi:hypothetical protein
LASAATGGNGFGGLGQAALPTTGSGEEIRADPCNPWMIIFGFSRFICGHGGLFWV